MWTSSHVWAKTGWLARTYIQLLLQDNLPGTGMIETCGERKSGRSMLAAWHDDEYKKIYWYGNLTYAQLYGRSP